MPPVRILLPLCLATAAAALSACGEDVTSVAESTAAAPAPAATTEAAAPEASAPTAAPAQSGGVKLVTVGRFDSPLFVTAPKGDRRRLFVVEQGGRIRVVRGGKTLSTPFLDISGRVQAGGEQGLLGLAFPPNYASSGRFYVYFTRKDGKQTLVEFRRSSADRANGGSARTVFVHDDPEGNHNGGNLAFGPDGLLYIGTGDGGGGGDEHGSRGNGQSLSTPLGKLLRIDPRAGGGRGFRIPTSNPFVGRQGALGEIYAYGLRNPWRFSFDRSTGDLVIGDVGQGELEEVNFVRKGKGSGANFGWRAFEGRSKFRDGESAPGHVPPVQQHSHGSGWCSITGGYIVRDPALKSLQGRYVYGDFCQTRIYSARLRVPNAQDAKPVPGLKGVPSLASFGEDGRARVYVVSLEGPVYRLAAK